MACRGRERGEAFKFFNYHCRRGKFIISWRGVYYPHISSSPMVLHNSVSKIGSLNRFDFGNESLVCLRICNIYWTRHRTSFRHNYFFSCIERNINIPPFDMLLLVVQTSFISCKKFGSQDSILIDQQWIIDYVEINWMARIIVCPRVTRLVAVIPRTSIDPCSSMIAESGKAGFFMMLISDPESNNKLVFVFKSGETILAVGVLGVLFNFIEITRRDVVRFWIRLWVFLVYPFVGYLFFWLLAVRPFPLFLCTTARRLCRSNGRRL